MFSKSMKMFEDDPFFNGFSPPQYQSLMPSLLERESNDAKGQSDRKYRDPFESMVSSMNRMMNDLHTGMKTVESNPDGHCYTSSTVMTYQNDGKSKPKLMQASTSTRKAPGDNPPSRDNRRETPYPRTQQRGVGGDRTFTSVNVHGSTPIRNALQVKETRRTYRDSESGVEKMAIGHHIGRRGHEIEKRRIRGDKMEEERRFYELNKDELPNFEGEWRRKTFNTLPAQRSKRIEESRREGRARNSGAIEHRPVGPSRSGRQLH